MLVRRRHIQMRFLFDKYDAKYRALYAGWQRRRLRCGRNVSKWGPHYPRGPVSLPIISPYNVSYTFSPQTATLPTFLFNFTHFCFFVSSSSGEFCRIEYNGTKILFSARKTFPYLILAKFFWCSADSWSPNRFCPWNVRPFSYPVRDSQICCG